MAEEKGIKETKEAIVGTLALGKFVAERLKDGADLSDAMALGQKLLDADFRKKLEDAVKDADQIPDEVKDLSFAEGAELVEAIMSEWNKAA